MLIQREGETSPLSVSTHRWNATIDCVPGDVEVNLLELVQCGLKVVGADQLKARLSHRGPGLVVGHDGGDQSGEFGDEVSRTGSWLTRNAARAAHAQRVRRRIRSARPRSDGWCAARRAKSPAAAGRLVNNTRPA
jgi:hypothetical protein